MPTTINKNEDELVVNQTQFNALKQAGQLVTGKRYNISGKAITDVQLNGTTYVDNSGNANLTTALVTPVVRGIIPEVVTTNPATLEVDKIYDLGEQTTLALVLPTSSVGHCIQINFVSGTTPTTLSVTSSAILSTLDLTPVANKVYTLFCDWTMLDGSNYGWCISYQEFTKAV